MGYDETVTVCLLAGGRSRRFGSDKALFPVEGVALIERLYAELRKIGTEVWISVRDSTQYYELHPPAIHVPDTLPGAGPLAGIAACMERMQTEWLLVVACDMPRITEEAVQILVQARAPDVDAVVAQTPDGRWHPLFALYHRRIRVEVEAYLASGERSLHGLLRRLRKVQWVVLDPEYLFNMNRPTDWPSQDTSGV